MMTSEKDVLIVDDDPPIRNLLLHLLTRRGLRCDTANDGLQALEKVQAAKYAVILVDLMMPRLDGAGFLEQVEGALPRERLPIVIMMTAAEGEAAERIKEGLVHTYVRKPFDTGELAQIVESCVSIGQRQPRQEQAQL